jgi:hypothetical protein
MGSRAQGEEAGPTLTDETPPSDSRSAVWRQARADVLSAVAATERLAYAAGVEAAARFIARRGQDRGGYFGQTAAALADMLRVAFELSGESANDVAEEPSGGDGQKGK